MIKKYSSWIGQKIKRIMNEGIRGKKVSQKQAVAVAISMAKKRGLKVPRKRSKK
jgi:hypothetical protein